MFEGFLYFFFPPINNFYPTNRSPKPLIKKKKTSDPNESIDVNSPAAKKIKEKFKSDISGDIVKHLRPYFSKTCIVGQIQSSDDFRHLARKVNIFIKLHCNDISGTKCIYFDSIAAYILRHAERTEIL